MKKLTSILAAALALAGCQPAAEDPADAFRSALPEAAAVQLGTPAADGTAPPAALYAGSATPKLTADVSYETAPPPAYPDQSEFATVSYWSAVGINGGTWWTLTLVKFVTSLPPTTCDDQACTWGPWLGDDGLNYWKLEVNKLTGTFDWTFAAQNAIVPGDWVSLISGHAIPGLDKDHGKGSFVIDFAAQAALAHGPGWVQKDFGSVTITYDNTGGISVDAVALGGHSADPVEAGAIINASYSFLKTGPGGSIDIAIDNLGTNEFVKLDTRWDAGGAGRGDAIYSPDGIAVTPVLTECWNGAIASWAETYDNTDPDQKGTEDLCVFSVGDPAGLSLPPR
jgi:hypothetical protein